MFPALDESELGRTYLVTHKIDTGYIHRICAICDNEDTPSGIIGRFGVTFREIMVWTAPEFLHLYKCAYTAIEFEDLLFVLCG